MKWQKLQKKDLAWSVTLLFVGVGGLWLNHDVDLTSWLFMHWPRWLHSPAWLVVIVYMLFQVSLVAAAGAGIGALFRRKLLGAGTAVLLMAMIALMFYLPNRHGK